jgi:hypothetical protein
MAPFQYRAFLSYSHRDMAWAKWLHKALESYSIDKDLIGRETSRGLIPKTLRPIFRDRDDFSAGNSLTDQTAQALHGSQFLIAICSPNAARSHYVNEEIRRFKHLGRSSEVIPVIVDGTPGDAERECFPPAVRFKLDSRGALTSEREEPIAADARPEGDGKEIAKQKIVAGLLGLGLDEIMRRAQRARKRRNRIRVAGAAAAIVVLTASYVGWSWAVGFNSRLYSSQVMGIETDAAMSCENAFNKAAAEHVSETRQVALAVKCVSVLSDGLPNLAQDARIPRAFIRSFAVDVAILKNFADAGKLTSEQIGLLNNAQALAERLKDSCGAPQMDGTGRKDDFGFDC